MGDVSRDRMLNEAVKKVMQAEAKTPMADPLLLKVLNGLAWIIMSLAMIVFKAFVVTKMWDWYVVPAFGVQPLRIISAFGISFLLVYTLIPIKSKLTGKTKKGNVLNKLWKETFSGFVTALFVLLVGWIGTFFI